MTSCFARIGLGAAFWPQAIALIGCHQDPKMDAAEAMASGVGLTVETARVVSTGPVVISCEAFKSLALGLGVVGLTSGDSDGHVGETQNG